jgi:hypothetical protein
MDSITQKADQAYQLAYQAYQLAWKSGSTPELENIISQDARYSYAYAREIIKSRFQLGEKLISQNPTYSYYYALNILRDRFKLGEKSISQNTEYSYRYAQNIIKGKLPEFMHNKMIAYAIINDEWAKDYFELINGKLPEFELINQAKNKN